MMWYIWLWTLRYFYLLIHFCMCFSVLLIHCGVYLGSCIKEFYYCFYCWEHRHFFLAYLKGWGSDDDENNKLKMPVEISLSEQEERDLLSQTCKTPTNFTQVNKMCKQIYGLTTWVIHGHTHAKHYKHQHFSLIKKSDHDPLIKIK